MAFTTESFASSSSSVDSCLSESGSSYVSAFLVPRALEFHIHALPYPSKGRQHHSRHPSLTRKASAPLYNMHSDKERLPGSSRLHRCSKSSRHLQRSYYARGASEKGRSHSCDESEPTTPKVIQPPPRRSAARSRDKPLPQTPTHRDGARIKGPLIATPAYSCDEEDSFSSDSSSMRLIPSSRDEKALDTPIADEAVDLNQGKDQYKAKDYFHIRDGMKYHPYDLEDAPYMQSYDSIQRAKSVLLHFLRSTAHRTLLQRPCYRDFA